MGSYHCCEALAYVGGRDGLLSQVVFFCSLVDLTKQLNKAIL
jgi:hypothetical protein